MSTPLQHLKKDPALAAIIEHWGDYGIRYRPPTFETLVRSIVSQQLNGKAASTIFGRLHAAAGEEEMTPGGILALSPERLREIGLSGQKSSYVRDLATKARDGSVVFESLPDMDDESVIKHLTAVKGIGVWTVQMFLMFALQRQDVLPTADLGIRTAMKRAYGLPELPKPDEMVKIAAPWAPHRTMACWYLWRSLDNMGGADLG